MTRLSASPVLSMSLAMALPAAPNLERDDALSVFNTISSVAGTLFRALGKLRLPDNVDLDLARIIEFSLDRSGYVISQLG